ncbi:hypothetical protein ACFWAP_04525 [Streptomyces goshikiensis]|uniref:hypothetical protein n=1 Tax=Streptomyces goshikiensis TaxID=1942 RepID=UPI0036586C36
MLIEVLHFGCDRRPTPPDTWVTPQYGAMNVMHMIQEPHGRAPGDGLIRLIAVTVLFGEPVDGHGNGLLESLSVRAAG